MYTNKLIKILFLICLFFVFPRDILAVTYCYGQSSDPDCSSTCVQVGIYYTCSVTDFTDVHKCQWLGCPYQCTCTWGGECHEKCGCAYNADKTSCEVDMPVTVCTEPSCWTCSSVDGGWSDCPSDHCGQTRTCDNPPPSCNGKACDPATGTCPNDDNGAPPAPTLVSPIGSIGDPVLQIPPVTLDWNSANKAEQYSVGITNLDTGVTRWINSITTTQTTVTLPYGNTYAWRVRGINTTCGTDIGSWSSPGYFMTDYVPTLEKIVLRNSSGSVVAPDALGRNNICQEKFVYDPLPRRVEVEATIKDTDIAPDGVKNATLRWNGNLYPLPLSARSGDTWVGTITLDFPVSLGSIGPYNWELQASDLYVTSVWIDSNRAWKIWDCQVEVDGTLYDGSAGQACDNTGFTTVADEKLAFASLIYKDMSASDDVTMNVSLPANYGINDVIYGKNYLPLFNGGDVASPDGTIMGTGRFTRSIDLNTGTTTCATYLGSISQFNLEDLVSAYEDNPRAKVDFSFIRDQESWFQVVGAGVKAKNNIDSGVPVTANATIRALSIGGIRSDNGLISYGGTYTNINGYNDSSAYGIPNNWWVNRNTNDSTNYSYQYFYNNFYVNGGVGETGSTWGSSHPSEGVYFVNGDLNVDNDFTLDTDKYLIVIVRGKITIANNVNRLDGIYIADGNSTDISGIEAGGESDTALTINGLLYSRKAIRLHRTFINKRTNNSTPAVRVNYNPNIIFNMPGSLMRVLSGWREE